MRNSNDCLSRLQAAGFTYEDATALRRISMTLHRWHELECGDGNNYASWCITRGNWAPREIGRAFKSEREFVHDENGQPFIERHIHTETKARYEAIPDRERGALKRLAAIMARYPTFVPYVQGDPRGCALYIIPAAEIMKGGEIGQYYTRGIAVYK